MAQKSCDFLLRRVSRTSSSSLIPDFSRQCAAKECFASSSPDLPPSHSTHSCIFISNKEQKTENMISRVLSLSMAALAVLCLFLLPSSIVAEGEVENADYQLLRGGRALKKGSKKYRKQGKVGKGGNSSSSSSSKGGKKGASRDYYGRWFKKSIQKPTDSPTATPSAVDPTETILELAAGNMDLSILATLITDDTQGAVVAALSGSGPFTVFAPLDSAFEELFETVDPASISSEELTAILTYHVVEGDFLSGRRLKVLSNDLLTTLNGAQLLVDINAGGVTINGDASVVSADILATNGVIHVIVSKTLCVGAILR